MTSDMPIYKFDKTYVSTKVDKPYREFDLTSLEGRHEYFKYKMGDKIEKIKEFLESHTFIAYMLAPKLAGKSTYLGMLKEIFGMRAFYHVSVGDLVRKVQKEYLENKQEYDKYLSKYYRGYIPLEEAVDALLYPDVTKVKPTELILTLIKREIDSLPKKTLFIDGFPRTADQISYSLYFRELINYREDPDLFVLIRAPISVLDARIKYRRICPKCNKSYNLKLLPTQKFGYDKQTGEIYMMCDNPECKNERLIKKQADDKGIEPLLPRIRTDFKLMDTANALHGVPKINIYNSVPVDIADELIDDYEKTPMFEYTYNKKTDRVEMHKKPWSIKDNGIEYYSLMAPAATLQFLRQFVKVFNLD